MPHHIPRPHIDLETRGLLFDLLGPLLCILLALALGYALTTAMVPR